MLIFLFDIPPVCEPNSTAGVIVTLFGWVSVRNLSSLQVPPQGQLCASRILDVVVCVFLTRQVPP